jgi:site-specific recombinase
VIYEFCVWLQASPLGRGIAESAYMFPLVESVHVLAIAIVVGSISIVDLRLLGWTSRNMSITRLSESVLPFTWTAFVFAVIAGLVLFASNATGYYDNIAFRMKMLLMLFAGVNMLVFQGVTLRGVQRWDDGMPPPAARIAGALSLALWIGVVAFGRWIGFI